MKTDSRCWLPAAHPDGETGLVHLLEERLLVILHCFLCCCPLLSFFVCIRWCLTILSFLVTTFVLSVLYVMSRDRKHLKRNDGYESDNSNNPGDWRERSDRDVDTHAPLPGRPTKQDEFMAGLLELMKANQLSQNRMLEEQARKDEERLQLQARTEEERRMF